jgi:uncharacterized protein (TIGR02118 family)
LGAEVSVSHQYLIGGFYNHPADPEAFSEHYLNVHTGFALELPNISRFTLSWIADDQRGASPYLMAALMYWDTKETAIDSFDSPAGIAAMQDVPNFAGAGVSIVMADVQLRTHYSQASTDSAEDAQSLIALYEFPTKGAAGLAEEVDDWWLANAPDATEVAICRSENGLDGSPPPYSLVVAVHWDSAAECENLLAARGPSGQGGFGLSAGTTTILRCRTSLVV